MSESRDIGVALSGGGHRATVFGLGVLLALVDQGLNERVVSISSVSGGSIANGIAMIGPDYGTVGPAEFEAHLAGPLSAISERGILLGGAPATRTYIRLLIGSIVTTAILWIVVVVAVIGHWWVLAIVAALLAIIAKLVAWRLFRARSRRTQRALDAELLGNKHVTLAGLRSAPMSVHHVLCTTELQTGTSFYFSNRMVYGYEFSGRSPCRRRHVFPAPSRRAPCRSVTSVSKDPDVSCSSTAACTTTWPTNGSTGSGAGRSRGRRSSTPNPRRRRCC
jgi:hypothetical protein